MKSASLLLEQSFSVPRSRSPEESGNHEGHQGKPSLARERTKFVRRYVGFFAIHLPCNSIL